MPASTSSRTQTAIDKNSQVAGVISNDLLQNRVGVLPRNVIHANRIAKMRELDALLSGIFITRAAISDVPADEFEVFMEKHVEALLRLVEEHSISVEERFSKAQGRYRLG